MSTQPYFYLWKAEKGDVGPLSKASSEALGSFTSWKWSAPAAERSSRPEISSARVSYGASPRLYAKSKVKVDVNKIFRLPERTAFNISGQGTGSQDQVANISSLVRTAVGGIPAEFSQSDFFANSPFYPIAGITTFFNFFQGIFSMMKSGAGYHYYQATGDKKRMALAATDWARALVQTSGGLAYGVYRGLTLSALLIHGPSVDTSWITVPTFLGRASALAGGIIGSFFFGVFYAILGLQCAYQYRRGRSLLQKLEQAEDPLAFLEKKVQATEAHVLINERQKALKDLYGGEIAKQIEEKVRAGGPLSKEEELSRRKFFEEVILDKNAVQRIDAAVDDKLLKDAIFFGTIGLKKCAEELHLGPLREHADYEQALLQMMSKKKLKQVALAKRVALLREKKEEKLAALSDDRSVKKLQKVIARPTKQREEKSIQKVVEAIKTNLRSNYRLNSIVSILCVMGIVATVLSLFFTGGIPLFAVSLLLVSVSIGMIGTDGYFLHQALKSGEAAPYDRKIMWGSIAIALGAFALIVGLTVCFHFAIAPIVFAAVVCAGTVITNGVSLYHSHASERKRKKKVEIDIQFFRQFVGEKHSKEEIQRKFERLSQGERKAIKEHLQVAIPHHRHKKKALREAVDHAISALYKQERKRIKALKESLQPLVEKYLPI
jgi:hypothetical protein